MGRWGGMPRGETSCSFGRGWYWGYRWGEFDGGMRCGELVGR
jgi:hypothetical protein